MKHTRTSIWRHWSLFNKAAWGCRARCQEGTGALRMSQTLSDPPPPSSVEARGWTSPEKRWLCRRWPRRAPARGMGLGVRAPRKRASDKQPRLPGRIPKGCCPAAQRSGRSPALSQKTEPQLYSSSIPASIKAICPVLTACQRAKLDPFRRMKTSATDFKYLRICSYTTKYNNWN